MEHFSALIFAHQKTRKSVMFYLICNLLDLCSNMFELLTYLVSVGEKNPRIDITGSIGCRNWFLVGLEDSTAPYSNSKFWLGSSIVAQMLSSLLNLVIRDRQLETSATRCPESRNIVAQAFSGRSRDKTPGFRQCCANAAIVAQVFE